MFLIKIKRAFLLLLFFPVVSLAQTFNKIDQGIQFNSQGMNVKVEFYTPSLVRVYKTPQGEDYTNQSWVVQQQKQTTKVAIENKDGFVNLASEKLTVKVNVKTGSIQFLKSNSENLLLDKDYGTNFSTVLAGGKPTYKIRSEFLLEKDEAIYGLGQILDNKFNRRHSQHHLQNENMHTTSPYFMSIKGYGVYMDNYSISDFEDNKQGLSFECLGKAVDYYFMYGQNADGVVSQIRWLTGKTPMLPLWAYGFFQSKERYKTQDESVDVVKKLRELKIPIDCIIQDWRYWPEYKNDSIWNSHSFDTKRFPDPKKWIDEVHKLNSKLMIVAWPAFAPLSPQRKLFDEKNMILNFDSYPKTSGSKPYDVYNPKGLEMYWESLNKGIYSYIKNDAWWLDSTEPDHMNVKPEDFEVPTFAGPYKTVKNAYSLLHNKGIAINQLATNPFDRVVILTRSGFFGQQRYGSITWSGDVRSTWDNLQKQVPASLNFSLMGLPYWNSDIGGFQAFDWRKSGGNKSPEYQELYLRWMQFGLFSTMMRSHGTGLPREIWNFGKRGDWCYDAQEQCINLRYSLLPYIYSTSWNVSQHDGTFMRALFMDFSEDKKTHDLGTQFLFGKSIMVAPITKYDVKSWEVYLPKGADWFDYWTNEKVIGGTTLQRVVDKVTIPLYIKAGSIIPFGPQVQYATEKKWDNLLVKIYPGADGTFTLYEDEFENNNYQKGQYSEILMTWNEKEQALTIGECKGKYKGMLSKRQFTVKTIAGAEKVVNYSGKSIKVKL
jgi:alpha-D-xyloside xylohydrolase